MKKLILLISLPFFLSGCATLERWHQEWLSENCNPSSAYSNGLSDGLMPGKRPNDYGNSCPQRQEEISQAYLRGFTKGLKGRPQQVNVDQNVNIKHKKHGYHHS